MSDMNPEQPVADSVEQYQDAIPGQDERDDDGTEREVPFEANEADAAEQDREFDQDDDDYR